MSRGMGEVLAALLRRHGRHRTPLRAPTTAHEGQIATMRGVAAALRISADKPFFARMSAPAAMKMFAEELEAEAAERESTA